MSIDGTNSFAKELLKYDSKNKYNATSKRFEKSSYELEKIFLKLYRSQIKTSNKGL